MTTKSLLQYCSQDKLDNHTRTQVKLEFGYGVTEIDVVSWSVRDRENSLRLTSLPEVTVHLKVFTAPGDCMLWGWATSDPCNQVTHTETCYTTHLESTTDRSFLNLTDIIFLIFRLNFEIIAL